MNFARKNYIKKMNYYQAANDMLGALCDDNPSVRLGALESLDVYDYWKDAEDDVDHNIVLKALEHTGNWVNGLLHENVHVRNASYHNTQLNHALFKEVLDGALDDIAMNEYVERRHANQ